MDANKELQREINRLYKKLEELQVLTGTSPQLKLDLKEASSKVLEEDLLSLQEIIPTNFNLSKT